MTLLNLLWLYILISFGLAASAPVKRPPTRRPTRRPTAKPVPNLSPVAQRIAGYCPGGKGAFVVGSYQYKALKWVESLTNANSFPTSKAVQYYTLACLYYATNAVSNPITKTLKVTPKPWISTTNWLSKTIAPCGKWKGITCSSTGKVTKIDLSSNQLSGTAPIELILLSSSNPSGAGSINSITFSGNTYLFTDGDNGAQWIAGLGPSMQYLYLDSTSLYAKKGVPDVFNKLVNLKDLDVSYTYITGALRSTPFTTLKKLEYLVLDGNSYNSPIPSAITKLPSLKYLYAVNANVLGSLSFIIGMPKIVEVWADQNFLKGKIPTQIGNLKALASFSISRNQLSGTIPSQMSKLSSMKQMWLYSNKLSGSFPNSFTTMKSLQTFHMESNLVKGTVSTLCSKLQFPTGALKTLGVDCGSSTAKVVCPSTCKVCCCSLSQCADS